MFSHFIRTSHGPSLQFQVSIICLFSAVEAIANASVDNRVAFGTFVDKPVETFVGSIRFVLKAMYAIMD